VIDEFPQESYEFPQDPKQIRARIRRYERSLHQEQERFGHIRDGSGKRYLLGPLHLLMGDTDGAHQSYIWFDQTFPDDRDEPLNLMCWTLVLYRVDQLPAAVAKLRQTMLSNLYVLLHLLGLDQDVIDMWHPSNLAHPIYVGCIPESIFNPWEPPAIQWADAVYPNAPMRRVRERYIKIYTLNSKMNREDQDAAS
jgi:hypothetical protein